jgi:hypothetical protein
VSDKQKRATRLIAEQLVPSVQPFLTLSFLSEGLDLQNAWRARGRVELEIRFGR